MSRSKERSFLLLLISMAIVGFVMWLDLGLSGGSATPYYFLPFLVVQAGLLVWLLRSTEQRAITFAEAGAAAPFLLFLVVAALA